MRNYLLSTLFLLCFNQVVSGQGNIEMFPSVHDKNPEMEFVRFVMGGKSGFTAIFYNKKTERYSLEKYNTTGKKIYSAGIKGDPEYEVYGSKSMYIFSSGFDKDTKKARLYMMEINAEDGTKIATTTIDDMKVLKHLDYKYSFSLSPDKTKLLVVSCYYCLPEELEEKSIFYFFEVEGMKKLWDDQIDSKVGSDFIKTKGYTCDNDGNVLLNYVAAGDLIELKHYYFRFGEPGLVYAKKSEVVPVELPVGTKDRLEFYSYKKEFTNDGKLKFFGMMREANRSLEELKDNPPTKGGVFYMVYDIKSKTVLESKQNWYDEQTAKRLIHKLNKTGSRQIDHDRKMECGPGDVLFDVDEVKEVNDAYYIEAHQTEIYTGYTIMYSSTHIERYTADNIMLIKMKKNGVVEWIRIIPRSISIAGTTGASHTALSSSFFVSDNKCNLIYLEHPDNTNKYALDDATITEKFGTVTQVHKANAILTTFDANGRGVQRVISENKDNKSNCLIPQTDSPLIGNGVIVFLENVKEKKRMFARIIL